MPPRLLLTCLVLNAPGATRQCGVQSHIAVTRCRVWRLQAASSHYSPPGFSLGSWLCAWLPERREAFRLCLSLTASRGRAGVPGSLSAGAVVRSSPGCGQHGQQFSRLPAPGLRVLACEGHGHWERRVLFLPRVAIFCRLSFPALHEFPASPWEDEGTFREPTGSGSQPEPCSSDGHGLQRQRPWAPRARPTLCPQV